MPWGHVPACQGHPGRHTATWPCLEPWAWARSRWAAEGVLSEQLTAAARQVLHSEAARFVVCWARLERVRDHSSGHAQSLSRRKFQKEASWKLH